MKERLKVVEFVTRLEFGGVEAMLMNYISHFQNPNNLIYISLHKMLMMLIVLSSLKRLMQSTYCNTQTKKVFREMSLRFSEL